MAFLLDSYSIHILILGTCPIGGGGAATMGIWDGMFAAWGVITVTIRRTGHGLTRLTRLRPGSSGTSPGPANLGQSGGMRIIHPATVFFSMG